MIATVRMQVIACRSSHARSTRPFAFSLIVATLGFLVINLTVSAFAIAQDGYLFWLLVTASAVIFRENRRENALRRRVS